jgi:hypothetical protein
LTCGWLVSEILRKLQSQSDFDRKTHIIGLKNCNPKASECYDLMLTQLMCPLHFIKDGDQLQIISKPPL